MGQAPAKSEVEPRVLELPRTLLEGMRTGDDGGRAEH